MSTLTRITFKHIKNVLTSALSGKSVSPTLMGRWNTNPEKNVGLVADYSNEDHCGPCGDQPLTAKKAVDSHKTQYNSLSYEDMKKYMIMRRRNFHTMAQKRGLSTYKHTTIESSNLIMYNNGCDSLSGDYFTAIPEAMEIEVEVPIVSPDGPDEDPDDDNEPNHSGGAPIILLAGVYSGYRSVQQNSG